jgi:hypothetical protein
MEEGDEHFSTIRPNATAVKPGRPSVQDQRVGARALKQKTNGIKR